ncbi:MAG TPA: helix-turn-helix transcriptional regulator [Bacteroidales bacterium]|nr:helix-turn-helix transcriptional regulator [Bacteroidales bacterium]
MKREENTPIRLESLSEAHHTMGLPKPQHPLISILNNLDNKRELNFPSGTHILGYYKISYKPKFDGKIKYGQTFYDFNEGGLLFAAPNQILGCSSDGQTNQTSSYYSLLLHPDFLWNYPLAKKIKQYSFFSYSANEALHLSDQEKETIISIFRIIEEELNSRIDEFSQDVLISQIELLLNYANRFYKRQFITRKPASNDLLQKLEEMLDGYFDSQKTLKEGIPTVQYLSGNLNVSPSYLSDMLRSLTGQNAQQHIHNKLIEKAKERLSITTLSVSEIGYELGFEHPQSFSRLFKLKTNLSPLEFRRSFN